MTIRAWAYSAVLVILVVFQAILFATRSDVEALVLRVPGQLYQKTGETYLSNLYNWEVINKTGQDIMNISFKLANFEKGRIRQVADIQNRLVPKQGLLKGVFFVDLPNEMVTHRKTQLSIEVYSGDKLIDRVKTNFLGPIK